MIFALASSRNFRPGEQTRLTDILEGLNDKLVVMINGTMQHLRRLAPSKRTWENVVALMTANEFVEPMDDVPIAHYPDELTMKVDELTVATPKTRGIINKVRVNRP